MITLAHVSDLHATPVRFTDASELTVKRALAWLSWHSKRRHRYRADALSALVADLRLVSPGHVAVTGDLTNASLASEIAAAERWLERLGGPRAVSLVPGNHDVAVAGSPWQRWSPYLGSDLELAASFPSLRIRGPLAVVGVCSAVPTRPFSAAGRVGAEQLERLAKTLERLAPTRLCRVVLVHHPPVEGVVSRRCSLRDAPALRTVLARHGADLVLHGHAHRTVFEQLEGPEGPIPVVGVRSGSHASGPEHKRAQYHVYRIERITGPGPRFRIHAEQRAYDPGAGCFAFAGARQLGPGAPQPGRPAGDGQEGRPKAD